MKNRQIFVLLTIVAMTLITSCKHEGSLDYDGLKPGDSLPEYIITTLDGIMIPIPKVVSKICDGPYGILLFRVNCTNCEKLMTQIARVAKDKENIIPIIALSYAVKEKALSYVEQTGLSNIVDLYLTDAKTAYDMSGESFPLLLLLDENNIVKQYIQAGKYTDEQLLLCISSDIE